MVVLAHPLSMVLPASFLAWWDTTLWADRWNEHVCRMGNGVEPSFSVKVKKGWFLELRNLISCIFLVAGLTLLWEDSHYIPPPWFGFDSPTWRKCVKSFYNHQKFFDGYNPCSEGSSPGPPVFLTPQKPTFQIPGRPKKITYDASLLTNHLFFILAITCPPFSIQSEGLIIGPASCTNATAVLNYNSECWFSCKSGYLQGGPGIKTCNQNNDWSPLGNPSCKGLSSLPIFFQRWTQSTTFDKIFKPTLCNSALISVPV